MIVHRVQHLSVSRTTDDWGRMVEVSRNPEDVNGMMITIIDGEDAKIVRAILSDEQIRELFGSFFGRK